MFEKTREPRLEAIAFYCPKCYSSTKGEVGKVDGTQAIQCKSCGATWQIMFNHCADASSDRDIHLPNKEKTDGNLDSKYIGDITVGPPPRHLGTDKDFEDF